MGPTPRHLNPLPLLDERIFLEECEKREINTKHAYTMWRNIIAKGATNVRDIPGLPKKMYDLVEEKFALTTSQLLSHKTSADGSTTKLLIRLQDGAEIETVIMRYGRFELKNFPKEKLKKDAEGKTKFVSNERATVCVSSQVGCQMGCTFCATGTMGLMSNLTAGEILEQLYHANTIEPIRNVVFMGMGEPLDNYDSVIMAVRGMTDVQRFSLSPSRIAVSTVGVVPKMKKLAQDCPEVGLAVSLHAPTQELREKIVPTAKAWNIHRIVDAMDYFLEERGRVTSKKSHILVEYVLIDDVNSSEDVAHELGQLLQGREVIVNVIPYNPTDVPHDYKPPSRETVDAFNLVLRDIYDLRTIVRQELGQDVNAACGQLVVESQRQKEGATKNAKPAPTPDIEDLVRNANKDSNLSSKFTITPQHVSRRKKKQKQIDPESNSNKVSNNTSSTSTSENAASTTTNDEKAYSVLQKAFSYLAVLVVFLGLMRLADKFGYTIPDDDMPVFDTDL
eukprot:m.211658 g.211658  ORF g.211658 m.211658 type:complete len:506 (-) comp13785_c3_seq53:3852-5369(-)